MADIVQARAPVRRQRKPCPAIRNDGWGQHATITRYPLTQVFASDAADAPLTSRRIEVGRPILV
jgi:hypothetical protein